MKEGEGFHAGTFFPLQALGNLTTLQRTITTTNCLKNTGVPAE